MTDRELMQQALEALTAYDGTNGASQRKRVLAALRERLAQPEQEPVAWEQFYSEMGKPKLAYLLPTESTENACYIPPAQRTWVGLTDEERYRIWSSFGVSFVATEHIESKLKEKNT